MCILDKIHDIWPPFQGNNLSKWNDHSKSKSFVMRYDVLSVLTVFKNFPHLKYSDPCNTYIIKWGCVIKWVWSVRRAVVIVLIPVYTHWFIHSRIVFKGAMTLQTVLVSWLNIRAFTGAAVLGCRTDEVGDTEGWLVKRWPVISEAMKTNIYDIKLIKKQCFISIGRPIIERFWRVGDLWRSVKQPSQNEVD